MPRRRPKKIVYKADVAERLSDEGLMTDDIEECLQAIVEALRKSDFPPADIVAWCKAMIKSDRVGCIYDRELQALQHQFEASGS